MKVVDVLLGLQWGDEGKGKIVDYLAPHYDMVARFQGGPNAGHTLVINGEKHVLHTIPSGIFHERPINLIGNDVVINPVTLKAEIDMLKKAGVDVSDKLYISKKAHFITPTHRVLDAASEHAKGKEKIGSTLRGIGPTYMDKTGRNGLRVGDALLPDFKQRFEKLKEKHMHLLDLYEGFKYEGDLEKDEQEWLQSIELIKSLNIVDSEYLVNDYIQSGKPILAEGAQGSMLDIDFGTYPYVTSSSTITAGACKGLGIAPRHIREVIGITKAYCTRVGSGPFPTELNDANGEKLRQEGHEFGATTGRPRRCGWIDLPALHYTCMINGVTQLALTKIDILNAFGSFEACTHYVVNGEKTMHLPYELSDNIETQCHSFTGWGDTIGDAASFEELPDELKVYIDYLEEYLGTRVSMISNGPEREKLITRNVMANPM